MADIFDFYVYDDRSIQFTLAEPIMLEDKDVTEFRFRIPKSLNGFDMSTWAWWFVYVNAKREKFSIPLTLVDDEDEPESFSTATFSINYGITEKDGGIQFALEVIDADEGGNVLHEWHTRTYHTAVIWTLQGNQVEYEEDITQDILSSILEQIAVNRAQIAVNKARIDNIASLPEGSTTADAELIDIRVGADGVTYPTAGDAVRGQITDLKEDLAQIEIYDDLYSNGKRLITQRWTVGEWLGNGNFNGSATTAVASVSNRLSYDLNTTAYIADGYQIRAIVYNKDGTFRKAEYVQKSYTFIPNYYYAINIYKYPTAETVTSIDEYITNVYFIQFDARYAQIQRYGRIIDTFELDGNANRALGQSVAHIDGLYYVCGSYNSNANQAISVYREIRQAPYGVNRYTDLGHANSIAATANYLAVATGDSSIVVLNRSDRTILNTYDLSDIARSIYAVSGEYLGNNGIYFIGYKVDSTDTLVIGVLTPSTGAYSIVCYVEKPANAIMQGMAVWGNIAYLSFNQSNAIYSIDITTGNIVGCYTIPDSDGFNPIGEMEDLFIKDGRLYIASCAYQNNTAYYRHYTNVAIVQLFATDIMSPLQKQETFSYMLPLTRIELVANEDAAWTFNPFGTYSTVEECALIANNLKSATIIVKKSSVGVMCLIGGKYALKVDTSDGAVAQLYKLLIYNSTINIKGIVTTGLCLLENSFANVIDCTFAESSNVDSYIVT